MFIRTLICTLLLTTGLCLSQLSLAGNGHRGGGMGHLPDSAALKQALNISQAQAEQVHTIWNQGIAQRHKLMGDYGLEPGKPKENKRRLSREQRRELRGKMNALMDDTRKQLGQVLSQQQIEKLYEMRIHPRRENNKHGRNKD